MKKIVALLLVMILTLGFSACGAPAQEQTETQSPDSADAPTTESAEPDAKTGEKLRVGFTLSAMTELGIAMCDSFTKYAEDLGTIEMVGMYDAESNVQTQFDQINSFVAMGVDAICVSCCDTTTAQEIVDMCGDIPVMFTIRAPSPGVVKLGGNTTFCGSDDTSAGRFQGEWLVEQYKNAGKTEINYVMLEGDYAAELNRQRKDGAETALEASGLKVTKVYEEACDWNNTAAADVITKLIGGGYQFDCIVALNDDMGLGASEAVTQAGLRDDVWIVGIDGATAGLEAVKNGVMDFTVIFNYDEMARLCLESIEARCIEGKELEEFQFTPYLPVPKEKADEYLNGSFMKIPPK